jgi:hypothetical protein
VFTWLEISVLSCCQYLYYYNNDGNREARGQQRLSGDFFMCISLDSLFHNCHRPVQPEYIHD